MKKISLDESTDQSTTEPNLSTNLGTPKMTKPNKSKNYFIALGVVILAGLFTGYYVARNTSLGSSATTSGVEGTPEDEGDVAVGKIYGNPDSDEFPDEAEGVLVLGGVDGEGSHHLSRQFQDPVYLTSSVVDLDLFIGHKIKVTGQTFNAKKAGWLMDAGSVEVLELNAQIEEE